MSFWCLVLGVRGFVGTANDVLKETRVQSLIRNPADFPTVRKHSKSHFRIP